MKQMEKWQEMISGKFSGPDYVGFFLSPSSIFYVDLETIEDV